MTMIKRDSLPRVLVLSAIIGMGFVGCSSTPMENNPSEFPRPGALSSTLTEGPHVIYAKDSTLLLQGISVEGQMLLDVKKYSRSELQTIIVHKSGFLPRSFEVELAEAPTKEAAYYPPAEKIFAVSDIEGNFNTLVNLMQQHGVINEHLDWSFGSGHFVMIGDVFDRGNHVTEMLWLIYHLEAQALENGGYVHLLMGNHEALNLRGDLRYIEPKYATFSKLTEERHGINYVSLFGNDSELGRWLRSKNVVEKIGDKMFVHAGISPEVMKKGYSLEEINQLSKQMLDTPKPEFTGSDSLMWGKTGPFWYRGYFDVNRDSWGPKASQSDVDQIVDRFDVSQIIVGHSHVEKPELIYEGRICAIDVVPPANHLISAPPWPAYGVLIKGDNFYIADENGLLTELED